MELIAFVDLMDFNLHCLDGLHARSTTSAQRSLFFSCSSFALMDFMDLMDFMSAMDFVDLMALDHCASVDPSPQDVNN